MRGVQAVSDPKPKKVHDKLIGARFLEAVSFGGTVEMSLTVPRNANFVCPARLDFDGKAVAIEKGQRADGLLFRKEVRQPNGEVHIAQVLAFTANVLECTYGEPDVK